MADIKLSIVFLNNIVNSLAKFTLLIITDFTVIKRGPSAMTRLSILSLSTYGTLNIGYY